MKTKSVRCLLASLFLFTACTTDTPQPDSCNSGHPEDLATSDGKVAASDLSMSVVTIPCPLDPTVPASKRLYSTQPEQYLLKHPNTNCGPNWVCAKSDMLADTPTCRWEEILDGEILSPTSIAAFPVTWVIFYPIDSLGTESVPARISYDDGTAEEKILFVGKHYRFPQGIIRAGKPIAAVRVEVKNPRFTETNLAFVRMYIYQDATGTRHMKADRCEKSAKPTDPAFTAGCDIHANYN